MLLLFVAAFFAVQACAKMFYKCSSTVPLGSYTAGACVKLQTWSGHAATYDGMNTFNFGDGIKRERHVYAVSNLKSYGEPSRYLLINSCGVSDPEKRGKRHVLAYCQSRDTAGFGTPVFKTMLWEADCSLQEVTSL